jgi:hypothetical protein
VFHLRSTADPTDRLPASLAGAVGSRSAIVIRAARPADETAIARLARLSDRRVPAAALVVAEVDGTVVAAAPVDGGTALTDPFAVTVDVTELLALRASQLRAAA